MRDADELALAALLGSRFPVIVIETPEEARALHLLERVANLAEAALYSWSATSGVRRVNGRCPRRRRWTCASSKWWAKRKNG